MPRLMQYQQALPTFSKSFNIGPPRWVGFDAALPALIKKDPAEAGKKIHRLVPKHLFYHACYNSSVG